MYTIGDFLIRVKNGYLAHQKAVELPHSKVAESIAQVLLKEEYIKKIDTTENGSKKTLRVELLYANGVPAMSDVKIISKPSSQVYVSKARLGALGRNIGTNIVSTSKGMMTDQQARKQGLGGELICQVL